MNKLQLSVAATGVWLLAAGAAGAGAADAPDKAVQPQRATAESVRSDSAILQEWDVEHRAHQRQLARLAELRLHAEQANNARQIAQIDSLIKRLEQQRLLRDRLTHEQLSPSGRELLANWMSVKQMGEDAPAARRVQEQLEQRQIHERERAELLRRAGEQRSAHQTQDAPVVIDARQTAGRRVLAHAAVAGQPDAAQSESAPRIATASERIEAHRAAIRQAAAQPQSGAGATTADIGSGLRVKPGFALKRTANRSTSGPATPEPAAAASSPDLRRSPRAAHIEQVRQLAEELDRLEREIMDQRRRQATAPQQ